MTNGSVPVEVLLVEDSEEDIVLLRAAFQDAKMLALREAVQDGVEAMQYLRREGKYHRAKLPGLVLLDINMPRKDGFQVLEEMKADPTLRHLPVVMLTTSRREEDVLRSYQLGACSFISKPFGFPPFQEMVKQFERYWAFVARVPRPGT